MRQILTPVAESFQRVVRYGGTTIQIQLLQFGAVPGEGVASGIGQLLAAIQVQILHVRTELS